MAKILIVEDERAIAELLRRNLTLTGHACSVAATVKQAEERLALHSFDLMLLDVMLPDGDGFSVMEHANGVPTVFLTARGGLHDRVRGLNMGADDYIVKPFELPELLARVQAVLRRTKKTERIYRLDDTVIDFEGYSASVNGDPVDLTPQEFALIETLILNRNIALSREKLLAMAWGMDFLGDSRTVDVHIQKLRKKLHFEDRIRTVYKVGYRLEDMR